MRYFALLLLVGCAPRFVPPPAPPAPPHSLEAIVASLPEAPPAPPPVPDPPPAANEQVRVLDALFPKHLDSYAKCKKPKKEPESSIESEDLELKNLDNGQFVPVVEARQRVHANDSDEIDIRYVVRIMNCHGYDAPLVVEAFFTEDSLTPGSPADWRRPRAIRYREWREKIERSVPRMGGAMDD